MPRSNKKKKTNENVAADLVEIAPPSASEGVDESTVGKVAPDLAETAPPSTSEGVDESTVGKTETAASPECLTADSKEDQTDKAELAPSPSKKGAAALSKGLKNGEVAKLVDNMEAATMGQEEIKGSDDTKPLEAHSRSQGEPFNLQRHATLLAACVLLFVFSWSIDWLCGRYKMCIEMSRFAKLAWLACLGYVGFCTYRHTKPLALSGKKRLFIDLLRETLERLRGHGTGAAKWSYASVGALSSNIGRKNTVATTPSPVPAIDTPTTTPVSAPAIVSPSSTGDSPLTSRTWRTESPETIRINAKNETANESKPQRNCCCW